jgi:lysophospholipase L1-like esterase
VTARSLGASDGAASVILRVLLAAFAVTALVAPTAAVAAPAPAIQVIPVSRYADGPELDEPATAAQALDATRLARVDVTVAGGPPCPSNGRWRVDGSLYTPSFAEVKTVGCRFSLYLAAHAKHRVEVRFPHTMPVVRSFTLDDKLVVSIGDSVASGEGNPGPHQSWASSRCHRSTVAGVEQAARVLGAAASTTPAAGRDQPLPSVTFVNLACSGATIAHGLLGDYRGIDPPKGASSPLAPQVDQLRTLFRKPDAVLVSIGANDVHFGDVVRLCALKPACPQQRSRALLGTDATADDAVGTALAGLGDQYDALAAELKPLVPHDHVLLTEYFDPTRDRTGATCSSIIGGSVSRAELEWAETSVLAPLNDEGAAATQRNGWGRVGGISSAFRNHGYCAKTDRWVVTVEESLPKLAGPLHPNPAGHLAIADAVTPPLGAVLGLMGKRDASQPKKKHTPWSAIVLGALGAVALLLYVTWRLSGRGRATARRYRRRLKHLLKPGPRTTESVHYEAPEVPPLTESPATSSPLAAILLKAGGTLATTVVSVGFVVLVGAAIVWVRFWAARYPADQAVDAVSREELLVIGAQALVLFAVMGVVAVVVMWLLDPKGTTGRRMTIALALLVFAELAAAVVLGDFGTAQIVTLVAGFAVATVLILFLFETLRRVARRVREAAPLNAWRDVRRRFIVASDHDAAPQWPYKLFLGLVLVGGAVAVVIATTDVEHSRHRSWWALLVLVGLTALLLRLFTDLVLQLLPLVALAAAVICALIFEHGDSRAAFALAPIVVAYLLFAVPRRPWTADAQEPDDPHADPYINAARAALAMTLLVCLAIFLVRDEAWLAFSAIAAVALAGLCLAIAWASKERFIPFAITVFFTVCVFGAVLACLRIVDSPQAQPVAILLKDKTSVCGVWVGESSGRVWYARLRLSEGASIRRPLPRDSSLTSVARGDIDDMALGPLQPVGRAQDQAASLRSALVRERRPPGALDPGARCGPLAPPYQRLSSPASPERARERSLAKSVQPELVVDRKDGFWPVSVLTLLRMQDRRARVCRRVANGTCVRMITQSDFSFNGGEGEWLDYPANPLSRHDERQLFVDALGSVDPSRTAREYFLVSRDENPNAPITVQFWFFYTYNYLQTGDFLKLPAGLHEGDFETVGFLLSAHTHKPRYVWMARHEDEGRMFVWDEDQLKKSGSHIVAYAARGSHASYESCRRQSRAIKAPFGLIDDRPQCDLNQELHLAPESTHLIDLSRVPWACWRGRFGEHPGGRLVESVPHEADDGPLGPLWQQRFDGVRSEPCRGVRTSDDREVDANHSPGEEVLNDKVSARLRENAGRLDPAVDTCADWEHAPSAGAFLLACDQTELTSYVNSGLERPSSTGLRIDVAGAAARPGEATIPAIRRDPREPTLDNWRITATADVNATIYAACQANTGYLAALFPSVPVQASQTLRVDGRDRRMWRLRDARGKEVAHAPAIAIKEPSKDRPRACGT